MDNLRNQNSKDLLSVNTKVNSFNAYLSRQGYYENNIFREINGILTLNITEIQLLNKSTNKIIIYFTTNGGIKNSISYNSFDKSWQLEFSGDDLSAWISTLNHPAEKRLDIEVIEELEFFKIYLSLNGK